MACRTDCISSLKDKHLYKIDIQKCSLPLLLGKVMRSDPLLEELEAPLLLSDPEQLLGAPLIGGESHNLSDEVPHKLVVFGHLSLGLGRLNLEGVFGGLVTLFQTNTDFVPRGHDFWKYFNTLLSQIYQVHLFITGEHEGGPQAQENRRGVMQLTVHGSLLYQISSTTVTTTAQLDGVKDHIKRMEEEKFDREERYINLKEGIPRLASTRSSRRSLRYGKVTL